MPSKHPPSPEGYPSSSLTPESPHDAARSRHRAVHSDVWPAVGGSLGLHGVAMLLIALLVDFRPPVSIPEAPVVRVTLAPVPAPSPPAPLPPDPERLEPAPAEPEQEPIEPTEAPIETVPPLAAKLANPEAEDSLPAAASDSPEVDDQAADIDLDRLRLQLRAINPVERDEEEVALPGGALRSSPMPWTERGDAIRGLPIGGGWLNPYVGPVQPRSESWGSQIGEQRGYYVLANGQAVCTRTPAPSFSELMHPWKAMRVTLAWDCGRARGSAPPPDDLDYAPAPAALRAQGR